MARTATTRALAGLLLTFLVSVPVVRAAPLVQAGPLEVHYRGELRALGGLAHRTEKLRQGWAQDERELDAKAYGQLRVQAWGRATSFFAFELGYLHEMDLSPGREVVVSTPADMPGLAERLIGASWRVHDSEELIWLHGFERLNLTLCVPVGYGARLSVGRMGHTWGFGRIWNPAERITVREPIESYRHFRRGADLVRLAVGLAPRSSVDVILAPGSDVDDLAALARVEWGFAAIDVAGTGGVDHRAALGLLALRADLDAIEIYVEGGYVHERDRADYGTAVLGLNTALPLGFTGTLEFSYNGSGTDDPSRYLDVWVSEAWQTGRRVHMGRWYGGLVLGVRPLAWLDVETRAIVNLDDASARFHLKVGFDVGANAWLGLMATVGVGETGPGGPKSEFGVTPYTYLADLRLAF